MDVIKEHLAKMRKEGKSPSIGDVTPAAKKEWAEIKAGKHPLYSQGSSQGKSKGKGKSMSKGKGKGKRMSMSMSKGKGKSSKNYTQKIKKNTPAGTTTQDNHQYCIEQMLKKVHLCKKDVNNIHKYLKTLKSQNGGDCACSQSGGSCSSCQTGGKKRKGRRTMKLKKGGKRKKSMKGGSDTAPETDNDTASDTDVKEPYVSIVDKDSGEYDGSEETDATAEKVVEDED